MQDVQGRVIHPVCGEGLAGVGDRRRVLRPHLRRPALPHGSNVANTGKCFPEELNADMKT